MTLLTAPETRSIPTRPDRAVSTRVGPLGRLIGADLSVPLVDGGSVHQVQLDNAASTQALAPVADLVGQLLPYYASVHRGAGYASQVSTELYEQCRLAVADFVGARSDDVVIFTRNTTDALDLLSAAVPGDVVVLDVEHHANLLPWQRGTARVVSAGATLLATETALAAELSRGPVALLAVTGASNVTGEAPDLGRLAALAHRHGARIVVDAAQLLPHRPLDLTGLDVDYVAFSGHKLYAPFGAGALVGRRDWLDLAPPHLPGGGAVREVTLEHTDWAPAPQRHEGGTPNVVGVAALAEACRALHRLGPTVRAEHESLLHDRLVDGLTVRGITPLRIWPDDSVDVVGVVSFIVPGYRPAQVAAYLSAEYGIAVRDGRFCAHPLLSRLGVADGAVRVSLGVGSSSDDVDRLLTALDQLCLDGPSWTYATTADGCRPDPDPRPLPAWWPFDGPSTRFGAGPGASPCEQSSTEEHR